jgi:sulfite oxidase
MAAEPGYPKPRPMTSSPCRVVHDASGLNTATWPILPDHFLTPVESFFTRSHAPVPPIDAETWRLEVGGLVERPGSYSLDELMRSFPRRQVTATLVCAGLRRDEFLSLGPLPGELPWGPEPISTGEWTGVRLGDLLGAVGIAEGARYVEFVGLDQVEREGEQFGFGGSIDLTKALSDEVLLASELNGTPLPPAHGFPLRAVVPGWIGARSVKWLARITLKREPSSNYFQSKAYRVQPEINRRDSRDVSAGIALSEVPVNAVILEPAANQVIPAGRLPVRGWALGSAGRVVTGVEVSPNDGEDWIPAGITRKGSAGVWSFWNAVLDLGPGHHTLAVRSTDTAGATQPSSLAATWNVKGYCNNAWHRVTIRAE